MEAIKLNLRCTSCPDGELMVLDQYVYCSVCDPRPLVRSASAVSGTPGTLGASAPMRTGASVPARPAPVSH